MLLFVCFWITKRFMDPLTSGKYPDSMRRLVGARLPRFTSQEAKDLKGSFDFLGLNYYSTYFTINDPHPPNPRHTDYILDARAIVSRKIAGHSYFYLHLFWHNETVNQVAHVSMF
jgi:beta-glucosidase/6-phospho-beta-glucosidase/beta-galactosidase